MLSKIKGWERYTYGTDFKGKKKRHIDTLPKNYAHLFIGSLGSILLRVVGSVSSLQFISDVNFKFAGLT